MADILLQTKLIPPLLRENLIPRQSLVGLLDADLLQERGFSRRLTLISASAGYGKTTLAAEWLQQTGLPVAWFSIDEDDNDPTLFMFYLASAVQQVVAGFGQQLIPMLQSSQPLPPQAIRNVMLNELAAVPKPLILVLDDYHAIQMLQIHENLAFILDHQPPMVHIVIVTRQDPLLPIARMRARGQVLEIRQEDLRFTQEEVFSFMHHTMGIPLSRDESGLLEKRTEGWAAGLQLAAISMRGQVKQSNFLADFTGSNRFVLDYLMEEVFYQQDVEVQEFLLKTAILDRLSGDLCDAVAERTGSADLLANLDRDNLFLIPLDPNGQWYRYHHLFVDLLRHRLQSAAIYDSKQLHQRACTWFQAGGFLHQAIPHAVAAQDWPRAAALIGQASEGLLKRGEIIRLINWCEQLPVPVMQASADLSIGYAWALLLISRYEDADRVLADAERSAMLKPAVLGQIYAAQAFLARGQGNQPRLIEKSRLALALLPERERNSRLILMLNLGLAYWHEGKLFEADESLQQAEAIASQLENFYALLSARLFLVRGKASRGALRRADDLYRQFLSEDTESPILALVYFDLSAIHYEWNLLDQAAGLLEQGLQISLRSGNIEFQNSAYIQRAFIRHALGDLEGAFEDVSTSHNLSQRLNPATQSRSAACHAMLALMQGELDTAARWVSQATEEADPHSFYRFICLVRPRLWIAQGNGSQAGPYLTDRARQAEESGCGYALVVIRLLQSIAAARQEEAQIYLQQALRMAEPEGFLRTFIDIGPALIPLLEKAAQEGCTPAYVGQILAAMKNLENPASTSGQPLIEPLSERELEVLRLAAAGLSNREIAEKLFISPGTVKTHLHNLCGKLGVRNRTEAAMRAKVLSLV